MQGCRVRKGVQGKEGGPGCRVRKGARVQGKEGGPDYL